MSMRADGLPIGDNPVFMIGADRFVEGPLVIGIWSVWRGIGGLAMD